MYPTTRSSHRPRQWRVNLAFAAMVALIPPFCAAQAMDLDTLARQLRIGDVVFIQVSAYPFQKVSEATRSWTNHVGIVVDAGQDDPLIAESTFPLSRQTRFSSFVARSVAGRVAVSRLRAELTPLQQAQIRASASRRLGVFYDTGFDLHSRREFCSRFVREVIQEATGIQAGEVTRFDALLHRNPDTGLGFWRVWYFGHIPWSRETVTPASLLESDALTPVFDGRIDLAACRT